MRQRFCGILILLTNIKNGWNETDTKITEDMFRNVFLPVLTKFCQTPPYSNGNWGIAVNKAQIAFAIFLNDRTLYNAAIDFFYHSRDNGSLPNYIAETGQIQESGRDQAHCMLGVGCLTELAECAWKQGDDLYAALNNRILKGYEYLSKVNLGYKDVPFKIWKDATDKYCNWQNMGEAGLGNFRAVFEIGYNHYVYRKGLSMPYTESVVRRIRPEGAGFTCDNPGFGTLLFYLGKPESHLPEDMIDEQLAEGWKGWQVSAPSLQPSSTGFSLNNTGISMQKTRIRLNTAKYPYLEVQFSDLPKNRKDGWLRLSYSVNSAPEFWTFHEKDAVKRTPHSFIFQLKGSRSNNKTVFTEKTENVTILLDFGKVDHVGVKNIISRENL